jgi:penicillin V acylase-like amidase (Ntn superfamily)
MRRSIGAALLAGVVALVPAAAAIACTTMLLGRPGETLLAFSYDFTTGDGALIANPRGAQKRAVDGLPPARWEARFASLTLNQFGVGMPTAGMNEAGLVVTLMWNDAVRYPPAADGDAVNELEFIQRLLDTAATVEEAVAQAGEIDVSGSVPIHYFVTDRAGEVAILGHRDGRLHVQRGADLAVPALTNLHHETLMAGLADLDGFGGEGPIPSTTDITDGEANSLGRFAHAARAVRASAAAAGQPEEAEAFAALRSVRNVGSQWNVVFDPVASRVAVQTIVEGRSGAVELRRLDLSCRAGLQGLPLAELPRDGAEAALRPFAAADNATMIERIYPQFPPTPVLPPEAIASVAEATYASVACPRTPGRP